MTTSHAITFSIADTQFRCVAVTDTGHHDRRGYQWLSDDGVCRVGRNHGRETYWASCRGVTVGTQYRTLRRAMLACVQFRGLLGVRRCEPADALRGPSSRAPGALFDLEVAA